VGVLSPGALRIGGALPAAQSRVWSLGSRPGFITSISPSISPPSHPPPSFPAHHYLLVHASPLHQSYLESVRLKASTATKRKERVDQFQALQYLGEHERLARCNSRLSCASERKKERERERAAAAGRHYQMVIDRVEEMKERGRVEAAEKRERCNERLKEAARRRAEREREGMERSGSESPERPRYGDPAHATDASPAAASSPAPAPLPAPANPPGRGHETKSSPPPMTYNRAVEILRACGIHSSAPRAPSVVSPPSGNGVPMPPPMNHPSVAIPFDRFAELIADREVLVATQRILRELLDTSEQKIAVGVEASTTDVESARTPWTSLPRSLVCSFARLLARLFLR